MGRPTFLYGTASTWLYYFNRSFRLGTSISRRRASVKNENVTENTMSISPKIIITVIASHFDKDKKSKYLVIWVQAIVIKILILIWLDMVAWWLISRHDS